MAIRTADETRIADAAALIRAGGLVAFPTETVYGLGANALDETAVRRIFEAKGRPATNPIIVHVASTEAADEIAIIDAAALVLMEAFWPGPLTLVVPKKTNIPDIVTAGGPTLAVRRPRHAVAQALLNAAGVPIAAPSANRSEGISPTRAEHVLASLGQAVDIILDGGPTDVGLESTVLDMTVSPPRLLRPGMITAAEIESVLGYPIAGPQEAGGGIARSPGRMPRHYAPRTPMRVCAGAWQSAARSASSVAVLAFTPPPAGVQPARSIVLPREPNAYAAGLYDALHRLDQCGAAEILVEAVPNSPEWLAIRDRLSRAAAQ